MLRCPKHPCEGTEIKEHEPGSDEAILTNAGEEASEVLIHQNEVGINGCRPKNGEECVNIS